MFFTASAAAERVVFAQNYDTIASVGDLAGTGPSQFSTVSAGSDGNSEFKINDQKLYAIKTGDATYPNLVATAGNLAYSITNGFVMTFDLAPVAFVSSGDNALVRWEFLSASDTLAVRFDIKIVGTVATPQFMINADGSGGGNTWAVSSGRKITIAVNRSGADYVYQGPDGAERTLPTGKYDVWQGTGPDGSKLGVTLSGNVSIEKMSLVMPGWSAGQGTVSIDNLYIRPLYSPSSATVVVLQ